ncbi:MAG TPA: ABC transporter permease [Bryobacteraceae bacterium]|nr:ABC transporter permease [Bryobacteraceae bacterium]
MQLKHVLRRLMRSPMFTFVTLLTIAIALGANSAVFSVVNGILLKPLPYPDPEGLVSVWQSAPGIGINDLQCAPSDFFTFQEENRTFLHFGIWNGDGVTITGLAAPERVSAIDVTSGALAALGIPPMLGRPFTAKDESSGNPETVILTYGYWQRRFGRDASVIGRRIMADGTAREIIGVMPSAFRFLDEKPDLIFPFQFDRAKVTLGNFSFYGIARLKPGVTLAQANADVARMIPMVNLRFPPPPGFSAKLFEDAHIQAALRPLKRDVTGDLGKVLWILMASIGVVLLIACANVANLLLVRAEGRQQELAVRTALGAGSIQIASQFLIESVLLGVLGGAAGLGLAYAALRLLAALAPPFLPRLENITIDPAVLLFTVVLSCLAGVLFGLIPVVRFASSGVTTALRAGGRTLSQSRETHRTRNTLVILQVALAMVLLISSGLMIRTFLRLRHVQPGFTAPRELQTLAVFIPESQIKEPERVVRMQQDMLQKIAAVPGVSSAAFANSVPTDGNDSTDLLYAEDKTYAEGKLPPLRRFKFVAPGFFHTMGTRLIAGRDLSWTDIYGQRPVVIVSENLARELWREPAAAIGKRIREGMKDPWREIVGVVQDIRSDGPDHKAPTTVYWPVMMKNFWGDAMFVTRRAVFAVRSTRAGSQGLLKDLRQAVWSVNSDVPLANTRTLEDVYRASMARSSFTLVMLAIAGGMALLLGVIGIYGVISYSVSQRTREMGIRVALGAGQNALTVMIVRQGIGLAAIGIAAGLVTAAAVTRMMASMLFEIGTVDPLTYALVAAGLLAAAATASYLPAHRASTINPADALRTE